jgi:hypothetical protein
LNGANAGVDIQIEPELPAYQGFSADCSTIATSGWSPPSIVDLLAMAKLKKILAGHGVSGVS